MKKWIALLLAAAMLLSMTACASSGSQTAQTEAAATVAETTLPETTEGAEATTAESATITVVDSTGREVEVPRDVKRVVAGWGIKNYIFMNIDDLIVNEVTDKFCLMLNPGLQSGGSIKSDGKTSVEAIAALEPDLVIMKWNSDLIDTLQGMGIPTLGLRIEDENDMRHAIEMFGQAFNREERAQEILDYYDTLAKKAEDLVKDIPEDEKKTAIFLGQYVGSTAPDTTLQGMAIEQAGGINPAADFGRGELWAQGGMERVMQWDPDFIFMANDLTSRDYTLESTVNDPANAALKAVQDGHVYESPCSLDLWMYPTLSIRLGVLWMINRMYPERFSDEELAQTATEFYKTIYGLDITREQLGF